MKAFNYYDDTSEHNDKLNHYLQKNSSTQYTISNVI